MTEVDSAGFQAELLDDFYAECDEHLANVRAQVLAVEDGLAGGRLDRDALDSCFRSMHSLKGNAAIVGLRQVEELAHAAEGILRAWLREGRTPTERTLQLIGLAAQRLDQIVGAHRLHQTLPDVAEVIRSLHASEDFSDPAGPAPTRPPEPVPPATPLGTRMSEAGARGLKVWRCVFSPSQELDRRGVNISAVRNRLTERGEILSASPVIAATGAMRFEFVVALRADPTDPTEWSGDGMLWDHGVSGGAAVLQAPLASSSSLFVSPSHIVRVDLSRLDDLMRITGEMVIHRSRLDERIARNTGERSELQDVSVALSRSLRELREALTRVRMVSVAEIFSRLPFVVRDLARDSGKRVRLVVEGQHTEIDKYLVERLKEPLLHLVRNAISHGVESPEERAAAGKGEEATLRLCAEAVGQSVVIRVQDDGRGIDRVAVASRALSSGLPVPGELDDLELLNVLCASGFSTRDEADRASGRGMGMAVVKSAVRELAGSLSLETERGVGTKFTIRLPLTLSIAETFIVTAGACTCALPQEQVQEVLPLPTERLDHIHGIEVIPYRDAVLPLFRLTSLFQVPATRMKEQPPTLVLKTERGLLGLVVDRVLGRREVVMRSMQDPLIQIPGVSGATELGDGKPVLILDPAVLAARLGRSGAGATTGRAAHASLSTP